MGEIGGGVAQMRIPTVSRIVAVGTAATVTMDVGWTVWTILAGDRVPDKVGPDLLGRWARHLLDRRVRHADIREAPPVRNELATGMAIHYATGVALTATYFALLRALKAEPSLPVALAYGAASGALPWLVLYPAYGYGWFGLREEPGGALIVTSAVGHVVFGFGIGAWTKAFASGRARR
jgi:hypothetical protein